VHIYFDTFDLTTMALYNLYLLTNVKCVEKLIPRTTKISRNPTNEANHRRNPNPRSEKLNFRTHTTWPKPKPYQTIDTANWRHVVLHASHLLKRALLDTLGSATREGCEQRLAKRNSPDTHRLSMTDSRDQWLVEGD
jgi:hypothetical protein